MTARTLITAAQLTVQHHALSFEPPYAWPQLHAFYHAHPIPAQEWLTEDSLGRTFALEGTHGYFTAQLCAEEAYFKVELALDHPQHADKVIQQIRHMLDLDSSPHLIEQHLHHHFPQLPLVNGLRIPRLWSTFEAGIRAILGQQISVGAASKLVNTLVEAAGQPIETPQGTRFLFPTAAEVIRTDLSILPMVNARRDTLKRFATWYSEAGKEADDPTQWLALKGIGPWTVNSAAMRGRGDLDMWIGGDLGIRKVIEALDPADKFDPQRATPWRSYLTQQLWSIPTAWTPARRRALKQDKTKA